MGEHLLQLAQIILVKDPAPGIGDELEDATVGVAYNHPADVLALGGRSL